MPLPSQNEIEDRLEKLLAGGLREGHMWEAHATMAAARMQAYATLRLALSLDRASQEQQAANRKADRLANVGTAVALGAFFAAIVQIFFAILAALG